MRAKLPELDSGTPREPKRNGICDNPRYRYCPRICKTGHLHNSSAAKRYWTFTNINCQSNNLIYCLRCKRCKEMYVGQTSKSIKERFGGHFYSITIGKKANLVAKHFDSQDHKVHVLGFIHNTPTSETARKNRLKVEGM